MIESLQLINFKNFQDAALDMGKLKLLVGTNASRKSSLRDAFRSLHGISRGYGLGEIFGEKWAEVGVLQWHGIRGGTREAAFRGLFPELDETAPPAIRGPGRKSANNVSDEWLRKQRGANNPDNVHAAMLLQSSGRANALRALLKSETECGLDFLRLAHAFSALYPKDSDQKRLLDAMRLAVPR